MNIVVIGSGYVGTTAAALFAAAGHSVTAIDIDKNKVDILNSGKAPFFEEGLDNIIAHGVETGSLTATTSYDAVKESDVVFSCVGTPDNEDGSSNLSYVYGSAEQAGKLMKPGTIFVQKSTVPVGTGRKVIELLPDHVSYVSNPEFLRESTAVYDTVFFDRVVAGGEDSSANERILELHRTVEEHASDIAKIANIGIDLDKLDSHTGEYVSTHLESAELIKVTSNAFLALKISFANNIAKLCDVSGADIDEVMSVVGEDKRIGKAFFKAGRGYGGGCFPKDVSGLISSAKGFGVDMPIMQAASDINASMARYIVDRVAARYGALSGVKVGVLGLAFKPGTSDTRKSPAIKLANMLVELGASVSAYDPQANEEAKPDLNKDVLVTESMNDVVGQTEIIFIATDWPEFKDASSWIDNAKNMKLLVDSVNCVSDDVRHSLGNKYIGVGKNY